MSFLAGMAGATKAGQAVSAAKAGDWKAVGNVLGSKGVDYSQPMPLQAPLVSNDPGSGNVSLVDVGGGARPVTPRDQLTALLTRRY